MGQVKSRFQECHLSNVCESDRCGSFPRCDPRHRHAYHAGITNNPLPLEGLAEMRGLLVFCVNIEYSMACVRIFKSIALGVSAETHYRFIESPIPQLERGQMKFTSKLMLATAGLATIAACSSEMSEDEQAIYDARVAEEEAKPTNLTALLQDNPDLTTAARVLVGFSGIAAELKDDGPFTSFVGSNAAFEKIPSEELDALITPEKKDELAAIAKFGLVNGSMSSEDLAKAIADGGGTASLTTLQGGAIKASMDGDKIVLEDGAGNKAGIVQADIESSNGKMHILDTVLMPS